MLVIGSMQEAHRGVDRVRGRVDLAERALASGSFSGDAGP